jgi:hypothetical protein
VIAQIFKHSSVSTRAIRRPKLEILPDAQTAIAGIGAVEATGDDVKIHKALF